MNLTETHTFQHLLATAVIHPTERPCTVEGDFYALGKALVLGQHNPSQDEIKAQFITAYRHLHTEKHTHNLHDLTQHALQKDTQVTEALITDLNSPEPTYLHHHRLQFSLQALGKPPEHLRELPLHRSTHHQDTHNLESWVNFLAELLHELGIRVPAVPLFEEGGSGYAHAPPADLYAHLTHISVATHP